MLVHAVDRGGREESRAVWRRVDMATDYWSWHPTAGKPWVQPASMVQARPEAEAGAQSLPPPVESPDRPRVLFRLYGSINPEDDTETMDAHEYAVFCTDYADVMQKFASKCRLKQRQGKKYKELGDRVPTQEDYAAAKSLSDQAEVRRAGAEAYIADPEGAPAGAPPMVDELRTEFANDPPSCPHRLELLLRYAGHDVAQRSRLESMVGVAESPWSLGWSHKYALWFWHDPAPDDGSNGSTWLRPVRKSTLRRVLKARVKPHVSESVAQQTQAFNTIDQIQTSRELRAHITDPGPLLTDMLEREVVDEQMHGSASESERSPLDGNALPASTPSGIDAVSVVLGYDYRLRTNEERKYVAGAEERPLLSPSGLALDRDRNRLFVSEKHRVRALFLDSDAPAEVIAGFQGTDDGGQIAGFVDGEGGDARFNSPGALAFDPVTKLLYVADTGNHAIRAIEEKGNGWRVTTVVGTGFSGGFGGPAIEYCGRLLLHRPVSDIVDKAKELAVLTVGKKNMLPSEDQALLSKIQTTGFRQDALDGSDEGSLRPAVEWRASVEPLLKQQSLPEIDGKPIMLPAQIRGTIETTHNGQPRERMLAASEEGGRVQDIAPLTSDEVKRPIDVCIEIRGAKGLAESSIDGECRGYAAVITWGPGASSLIGKDGSGTDADGLRLLRQRMLHLKAGESGHPVGQKCKRWCTALAPGPDPVWNELLHVTVPHGERIDIVVDVWSAASLCSPQAIALSPAVGSDSSVHSNDQPEILIGCGDTQEPGSSDAQAEVGLCDAALSALGDEDARITRAVRKCKLADDEKSQLTARQADLKKEQEALVKRRRTALERSTAANSIRLFKLSASTHAGRNGILRNLVRGGEGIVDPCAIVVQSRASRRRYVVVEGCRHRLVELLPNGYFRPLGSLPENSSAACCTPSGDSMFTIDTCNVKRNGGLEELGRLRQAKFSWQWGEEKSSPPRVEWHHFDEADQSVIEQLHREYVSRQVGNAHIAQFTMAKDRIADLAAINVYRFVESYLKVLNRTSKARPVPTSPIVHLLRNYGAVPAGKMGRLIDFETMRAAIDSTIRRPISQYTRVAPRTSNGIAHITGVPTGDPIRGKVGGFFSEWVKVRWDDAERDKKIVALIVEHKKKDRHSVVSTKQLEVLDSRALRAEALKVKSQEFRRQLNDICSASLQNTPGADRARRDLMRRKAQATRGGANVDSSATTVDPLLRSPWIETSSLKVLMLSKDERNNLTAPVSWSESNEKNAPVLPQVGSPRPGQQHALPRKHTEDILGTVVSKISSPVERWLLRQIDAGTIPWLEPLAESPAAFREFARSLQTKTFQPGKTIIAGGHAGPADQMPMYILTAGEARATGKLDHTEYRYPPEETVMMYTTPGQTFGELAMLSDCSAEATQCIRAATVEAVQKCAVLVVSRASFVQFIQKHLVCMKCIRDHEPREYWGEYKDLKQQKRISRPSSRARSSGPPAAAQQTRNQSTGAHQQANKVRAKAVTKMWTSGPGGGGPVTALPADLNWRPVQRSDRCTMHVVRGSDQLPLRDPRAILPLDEKTLLVADRWIDEKTSMETGAIWKIRLDMLTLAEDLKVVADESLRTKFYARALDNYITSSAIFSRNEMLRSQIIKTTELLKSVGPEPGAGPQASEGTEATEDDNKEEAEGSDAARDAGAGAD